MLFQVLRFSRLFKPVHVPHLYKKKKKKKTEEGKDDKHPDGRKEEYKEEKLENVYDADGMQYDTLVLGNI